MSDDDAGWDDDDYEVPDLTRVARRAATEDEVRGRGRGDGGGGRGARGEGEGGRRRQRAAQSAREKAKAAVKTRVAYDDDALDDPVAEKARRQRLVEEADLRAAQRALRRRGGEVGRVRTEE